MATEMRRSYLVQRLDAPHHPGNPLAALSDALAFGGGLKHGGLSDQAMALLRGIFSFDYMGSAEFEFGAVPETLQALARDAKKLTAFPMTIDLSTVPLSWRAPKDATPLSGTATVYVLCRRGQAAEVRTRVYEFAAASHGRTKENVGLDAVLRGDEHARTQGWLELDNGFFFFVDEAMWQAASELFGVAVKAVA